MTMATAVAQRPKVRPWYIIILREFTWSPEEEEVCPYGIDRCSGFKFAFHAHSALPGSSLKSWSLTKFNSVLFVLEFFRNASVINIQFISVQYNIVTQ